MQLNLEPALRQEVLAISKASTARFILGALLDWTIIAGSVGLAIWIDHWASDLTAMILVASRQHGLMILVHDATHYRVYKKPWLNDLISDFLCAFPVFFDTVIYRHTHLQHHEHLNTDQDPDWIRKILDPDWHFPKTGSQLLKLAFKYLSYKGAVEWLFSTVYFSGLVRISGVPRSPARLMRKLGFWSCVIGAAAYTGGMSVLAQFWVIPFFFIFPTIQRIRSIAEHFAVSYDHELTSSREITPGWTESLLLAPHNVHIHLSHHLFPSVPYYNLRKLHNILMRSPAFSKNAKVNVSYFLPLKNSMVMDLLAHQNHHQSQGEKANDENHEFRKAG